MEKQLSYHILISAIKQLLNNGASPKALLKEVYETIDKHITETIQDKKTIVYNVAYGGYGFSEEFELFVNRYGKTVDGKQGFEHFNNEREEIFEYIQLYATKKGCTIEQALEQASGQYCQLRYIVLPYHKEYSITEYDGAEKVETAEYMEFCEICCWHQACYDFDDSSYSQSKTAKNGNWSGYNRVINPNGYNKIYVCHNCLITNVYVCDTDLKDIVIRELVYTCAVNRISAWWKSIIYDIDNTVGKRFVMKQLSAATKNFFLSSKQ